jgi:hypothetical protein
MLQKMQLPLRLAFLITLSASAASATSEPSREAERFTGSLVNTVAGAARSQPFVLTIARYASNAEVEQLTGVLAKSGAYPLRDAFWRVRAGTLSIGGGLGLPVSVAVRQETASGSKLYVFLNRPLSTREVAFGHRSAHYPFSVLELDLDQRGHGEGVLIAAARLRLEQGALDITSLGIQPLRLLAVRED